jgi:hypothetical protein
MTQNKTATGRHVKGTSVVDLVKALRKYRQTGPLPDLSPEAKGLLETRILSSAWYPLEPFLELLKITDELFLKGNEQAAVEMGALGGINHLQNVHKAIVLSGDPKSSVMAMRHVWRAHDDFGDLTVEIENDHAVVFALKGYEDIKMVHAMMTAGWGVAAARVAGSEKASVEAIERPWKGASQFRYRIRF